MVQIKDRGQSMVELGVTFVILMFLLSGAVEFGIALFQFVQLRDAVQEGALYGSHCNCALDEIESRVRSASDTPLNLKDDSVSISMKIVDRSGNIKPLESRCESDALEVQASYSHKIFMPFLPKLLGVSNINLNASVTNTVLYPVCQ